MKRSAFATRFSRATRPDSTASQKSWRTCRSWRITASSAACAGGTKAWTCSRFQPASAAIRIGSCGALQKGIGLGELVLVSGAVREDGASKAYVPAIYPAVADFTLYGCCAEAAKTLGAVTHEGICHSHESFYHEENEAESAYWSKKGVLGADMETAALFTIGRLRGMKTASILNNVVLYGEDTADAIGDYVGGESATAKGERLEILTALEAFYLLETRDGK